MGAYSNAAHTSVNVTTASTQVLAENNNRLYALFVNDSDTTVYLKLGAAAVANQGIRLNANGGTYEMSRELGNLYAGSVFGIHAGSGNKLVIVTEGA